jgi:hypothetical protein
MARKHLLSLLKGGDRRSIGRSDEVVAIVSKNESLFPELMDGWWSLDPVVRMRSADATEKVSRKKTELLLPYKKEFLGLMAEAKQPELRWHLAAIVPRLSLSSKERQRAGFLLNRYLGDRSSIVKTFALQGLAELALDDPSIRSEVTEILREATQTGTPAMKARSRKLLLHLDAIGTQNATPSGLATATTTLSACPRTVDSVQPAHYSKHCMRSLLTHG